MSNLKPGILAVSILIASLVYVAQALLLQTQEKATIFLTADGRQVLSYDKTDCSVLPLSASEYCENIQVTRFGYTAVVANPVKSIPENNYVANLSQGVWRYPCFQTNYEGTGFSVCRTPQKVFSSASMLYRDDKLFVILNLIVSLFVLTAGSYLVITWGLKFLKGDS